MAQVLGGSQRNINNQVQNFTASQLATKNSQKYQSGQFNQVQHYQCYGQGSNSPGKANVDNLYDQNVEQQSIQAGSSLTLAVSQRNSQISIRDYQNYDDSLSKKQSIKKQNMSPWRRNINNQKVIIGSKNGFYINNDTSTISSSSAQKQNSYQQSMSPKIHKITQQSLNQNELQSQKGRNSMNSSYFLHVDTQQSQQDNMAYIQSKNNNRNNSYQHRNSNNFQSSSPQQSQATLANDLVHYSNSNKNQHRKNYQHHNQRKVISASEAENMFNQGNYSGQTALNVQCKQKKDPQTARTSQQLSNNQKKLRLHSLNANIHRIFKEDKFQQQSNSQFTSESTDQSQKKIPTQQRDYQTRVSQENLSIKDSNNSMKNQNENIDETDQVKSASQQAKNFLKEEAFANKKQETCEQKGLNSSQITACGSDQDNIQGKFTQKEPNKDQIIHLDNQKEEENGYTIQNNDEQKKIQSYTEDTHLQGEQQLDSLNRNLKVKENKQSKVLHTEPENESRRQNKIKNIRYSQNKQQYVNQQLNTQEDQIKNNRAQAVSTSPRSHYNFKQRSNTQASDIPPKINMEIINGNQQLSPRESYYESPIYISQTQFESQENIARHGGNSNQFYFINNSPLLKCKVSSSRNGYKTRKNGANTAIKNYINNSLMIKQNYLNIQQQIQGKQCRTQVDSSFSLVNQGDSKKSPALVCKNTDRDNNISLQYFSINEADQIQQYQHHQPYQHNLDQKLLSKDKISKFQGNVLDSGFNNQKSPLKEVENNSQNRNLDQNQSTKNKFVKQDIPQNQRGKSFQQYQRQYVNSEITNNSFNNGGYNKKYSVANTSVDNKQQKVKIKSKIYSTNSSNQSLNASILEKSQIYVDKYKSNLQNDLSLIQKIDKQKQVREGDLYNVSYNDKKHEYAQEIDKKIQYLSHTKIESSDLRSNQQNQNYSPKISQSSQSGNYQNYHPQSLSSQSNNPYSPIFIRGNTQMNDYNNIHTSLSNVVQNEQTNQQNQQYKFQAEQDKNNFKNEISQSQNNMRENDTQLSYIWRKLAYQREKGKLNQSSLEEELEKIDLLTKKNEKALNQYVQIKEDAIQMSQFLESHLNQKRVRNNSQGNI
ncbi:cyclic nucleotide-binding domain protein (macronuclear) [Tetrahymena thermophila SB210]|uniref:Cyclic nucleotide-binding domain protein n=1 Tax=Tetrahymena thermophila (strain SB210) TaxID=312017 RepID=Q23AY1_TETTS|nr:cyclic nucleotide-binding domain protein [Tetrahymena thermophila SB210]EAR93703.2 cyclic nucleotide-binding domain protein [Tetrahymena thermophila SB210]|eukprot:XP_001013948.2 cyclic nucleotide-binding domain protein [Tetrahymena thermophila SB210]